MLQSFLENHRIDWPYVVSAFHALVAVDAITFENIDERNVIVFAPSTLITGGTAVNVINPLDHSRPFDVHTWSDHPEVNSFVDEIYFSHFSGGNSTIRKKHLKVILLALYVAWCDDPDLKIGFSRDVNAYQPHSRYNALNISKKAVTIVDRLSEVGLIEQAIGFNDRSTGIGRTSRIWPTGNLIVKFKEANFGPLDIDAHAGKECIILRNVLRTRRRRTNSNVVAVEEKTVDIEYRETPATRRMREHLTAYNDLLRRTFIDIPTLETPYIDLDVRPGEKPVRIPVNQRDKFVRRIFNRASWEKGGRFWGGWWQRCPKEWREAIFLDDAPVSEIDYSGLHIVILYAQVGIDYWTSVGTDPYEIEHADLEVDTSTLRSVCKELLLVALNARDELSAFQAFRYGAAPGTSQKTLTNLTLKALLQKLREKHWPIAGLFASDAGIDLMWTDSQITGLIIDWFTYHEIPILTVHDSYIVPMAHVGELKEQMLKAFQEVTGIANPKLKEVTHNPHEWEPQNREDSPGFDYTAWEAARRYRYNPPRSQRYQYQLAGFRHPPSAATSHVSSQP